MGELESQQGRAIGPIELVTSPHRVAEFAAATGVEPGRWSDSVPPLYANSALFAAAPAFLYDPEVAPFTRSLIHSTQEYSWERALAVGETVSVTGRVESVRSRGPLYFVGFALDAEGDAGPWLRGASIFLMSREAAAEADEEHEPPVDARPLVDTAGAAGPWPDPGEALAPYRCGASRTDLVRYAAASGDWNPIHWDHDSARAAGLSGTIVHGLLMAAWMANAVLRHTSGTDPIRKLEVRFRSPLRPAVGALVTGSVTDGGGCDLLLSAGDQRLVSGRIQVTP